MKKLITLFAGLLLALSIPVTSYANSDTIQTIPITAYMPVDPGSFNLELRQEKTLPITFAIPTKNDDDIADSILEVTDKQKLESGVDVTSTVTVTPADYKDVKDVIEAVGLVESNKEKQVFDISVKMSYSDSENDKDINVIPGTITLQFSAPKDYDPAKYTTTRLVHVHQNDDGTNSVIFLPVTYDKETNYLSFETSKFSTYVFYYEAKKQAPAKSSDSGGGGGDNNETHEEESAPAATPAATPQPQPTITYPIIRSAITGDSTVSAVVRIILVLIASAIIVVLIKTGEERSKSNKKE